MVAHSYERVMPGNNYLDSIINFWPQDKILEEYLDLIASFCQWNADSLLWWGTQFSSKNRINSSQTDLSSKTQQPIKLGFAAAPTLIRLIIRCPPLRCLQVNGIAHLHQM